MNDQSTYQLYRRFTLLLAAMTLLPLIGCRQPVANPQAGRSLIPNWLGGQQRYANNRQDSYLGQPELGSGILGRGTQTAQSRWGQSGWGQNGFAGTGNQNNIASGYGQTAGQNTAALQAGYSQAVTQQNAMANQLNGINQRLNAYDADNQLLNTEVAALKQKLQLANQYNQTLKDQLADTSNLIQRSEMEKQAAIQQAQLQIQQATRQQQANQNVNGNQGQNRLASFDRGNVPATFGGATIRANNSLMQRFANIRIPGGQTRMDGDVIRIEIPSDRLFVPGTYQVQPAQKPMMQNLVGTIIQNFPRQIVGIEAHWDNTPLNPPTTTHHQLTATQALAMFDEMVQLGLPRNQMFTMAMASNRPRHPQGVTNGVSPNRRIELVIYPETYDGR
jgi:flagellar motor protein MotB